MELKVFFEKGKILLQRRAIISLAFVFAVLMGLGSHRYLQKQDQMSATTPESVVETSVKTEEPAVQESLVQEKEIQLVVGRGDTLNILLTQAGLSRDETQRVIQAIRRRFDPRDLKVGQAITVHLRQEGEVIQLKELCFKPSLEEDLILSISDEGQYEASIIKIPLQKVTRHASGSINSSFYNAALKQGVPATLVREAIKALSHDVNWQHEPKSGDSFKIVYEVHEDDQGRIVKQGDLKYVSFAPGGKLRQAYQYNHPTGKTGYYNAKGESFNKGLLRTPLDAIKIRISSKFSLSRKHPIRGYCRAHEGVDYAAPAGTDVYAAGDGVVVKAGWFGGYGKYVKIKHANGYETAYGHLSRITVKQGQRVSQGNLIGKVGSTGESTGAHLHHEVIFMNKKVDPQRVVPNMPARKLVGKELEAFNALRRQIDRYLAEQDSAEASLRPAAAIIASE